MDENLPIHVNDASEVGSITYASEVIAIIAGMAASEIDGVAQMGAQSSIADILARGRKPVTKGVKVEVGAEEASVDLVFSVEYGKPIQRVCKDVQESVRKSIETMTGLHVVKVDVHVLGVSFEKETRQLEEGAQAAGRLPEGGKRGHKRVEPDEQADTNKEDKKEDKREDKKDKKRDRKDAKDTREEGRSDALTVAEEEKQSETESAKDEETKDSENNDKNKNDKDITDDKTVTDERETVLDVDAVELPEDVVDDVTEVETDNDSIFGDGDIL